MCDLLSTFHKLIFIVSLLWNLAYCTHHYLPDRSRSSFVLTSNSVTRNKARFIKEIIIKHFISTASWINACNFCLHLLYGCKTKIFVLFMTWGVQWYTGLLIWAMFLFDIKVIKTCMKILRLSYNSPITLINSSGHI